jgi:hypothetical protein
MDGSNGPARSFEDYEVELARNAVSEGVEPIEKL